MSNFLRDHWIWIAGPVLVFLVVIIVLLAIGGSSAEADYDYRLQ